MKAFFISSLIFFTSQILHGQEGLNKEHIIELSKYFNNYQLINDNSKESIQKLGENFENELTNSVTFIKEITKTENDILTDKFLKLPDSTTLKVVYIIEALLINPYLETPKDPELLVDSLLKVDINYQYLIDNYYHLIFNSNSNKNQPFNMSKVNFKMNEYGLNTTQNKAIFYLRCMSECGSQIFGYMNIVSPPNTKEALKYIKRFPRFDGLMYYQYSDLFFEDFEMVISIDRGLQSYKNYFINNLFNLLLSHGFCLKKEKNDKEVQDFLLSSVLKDESLWKYTELTEVLESIFEKK